MFDWLEETLSRYARRQPNGHRGEGWPGPDPTAGGRSSVPPTRRQAVQGRRRRDRPHLRRPGPGADRPGGAGGRGVRGRALTPVTATNAMAIASFAGLSGLSGRDPAPCSAAQSRRTGGQGGGLRERGSSILEQLRPDALCHHLPAWPRADPGDAGDPRVFWGAPLIARELETGPGGARGTRLSPGAAGWRRAQALTGLAAMGFSEALSLMPAWWTDPIREASSGGARRAQREPVHLDGLRKPRLHAARGTPRSRSPSAPRLARSSAGLCRLWRSPWPSSRWLRSPCRCGFARTSSRLPRRPPRLTRRR